MQDAALLDAVERYIRGEMLPEEKAFFEHVRNTNPDVDQLVVEHTHFLNQLTQYGEIDRFKSELKEIHQQLTKEGQIEEARPAKVVVLWKKYKRVIGVAASIAGITALTISALVSALSPKGKDYQNLSRRLDIAESKVNTAITKINSDRAYTETAAKPFDHGGTGFLIDSKGYLVTNAHVVKNSTLVDVVNRLGEYKARIIHLDKQADLALLKIEDTSFHAFTNLPYSINKTGADLGEELFTLGYPRDEIVYNKGYLSAKTGFQGDTLACQITIAANPGNSGTPVINNDGEVIGIITASQQSAQGVVFAVRSKNIFRAVDAMKADSVLLKSDSSVTHLHLPSSSSIKGLDRKQQIKRIEDCIFIVKSN
ncbi:MAG: trypsin-like peptidase domain-containing protein [Bacteroidetes bacterium]|nr:trypsin-like peptidase domain-containing protein [Bacteroidota bacterium]